MHYSRTPAGHRLLRLLPCALLLLAFGLNSCDDDDDKDPCRETQLPKLSMRFLESTGTLTPDTAYSAQTITFEAPEKPYTSYEWQVGSAANTRTVRRFVLDFPANVTGNIPVRLIARRPPNPSGCFPKDDGVDTLSTVLTLMAPGDLRAPIYGKFQGANRDAPRDTFTVRVFQGRNYEFPNNPAATPYNYLRNLGRDCQSPYFDVALRWGGIQFSYGRNDFGCLSPNGRGYLTTRDSIRIDYQEFAAPTGLTRRDRVFLGKRIR